MNLVDKQIHVADSLINACLFTEGAAEYISARLNPDDFYHMEYRVIFKNIAEVVGRGEMLTPVNITAGIGDADGLIDRVSIALCGSYETYTGVAVEIANKRKLIALAQEIGELAANEKTDATEALMTIETRLSAIKSTAENDDGFVNLRDVAKEWLELLNQRLDSGTLRGLPTGFDHLDELTGGLQGGRLYVLAGRPGSGKSAFALTLAKNVSQQGKKVAIVSLEMAKTELIDRLAADLSGVYLSNIEDGFRKVQSTAEKHAQFKRVGMVVKHLAEGNISVCDNTDFGIADITLACQRMKRTEGVDLIIVDYLGLMTSSDDEVRELGEMSRALKNLASKIDTPIIALHQVNRKCEERGNKRPLMSDLRGSGKIEENANVVMFTYREDYYNKNPASHNHTMEIIIDKNRSGAKGVAVLNCDLSRMRITDRLTPFDEAAQ